MSAHSLLSTHAGTNHPLRPAPLVSVVMPNLNKGRFIEEAVKSVRSQSYRNLELLIVDNGSEDQSVSIAELLARDDKRIRLFDEPRRGVSFAINTGVKNASGELVTIMGSDDIIGKDKISRQVDRLQQDGTSVCYTEGWYLDDLGRPLDWPRAMDRLNEPIKYEGLIFSELIRRDFWNDFFGASVVYPKRCFSDRLFDTSLTYGEDWDFCVRLSRSYNFHYIPEPLYGYRVYSGNTWAKGNEQRNLRNKIRIFEGWLRDFDLNKEDKGTILKQLLQSREELEGRIGMVRLAITHPQTTRAVLRRTRSSISHQVKRAAHKAAALRPSTWTS